MADVRTPELVINKLTKQQYENIQNPSATEIYLVPEDEEHKPICYPTTASEVGTTSMLVKSSVSDNGKILTENGFVYNTSGNPTISDTKVVCDLGVGVMQKELTGLTRNTQYYIKSYGQNASGLVYGSELVQRTIYTPIPAEYQLVEYLESTGTQYLITNIMFNETLKINIKDIVVNSSVSGIWKALFGYYSSSSNSLYLQYNTNSSNLQARIDTVNIYQDIVNNIFNELEYFVSTTRAYIKKDGFYLVDVRQSFSYIANFIHLFKLNTTVTTSLNWFAGHIGRIKVFNGNDVLLFGLYPVYRIADNKPGMYDIVNGVFYTNQGTGEFIVGPDKEWGD